MMYVRQIFITQNNFHKVNNVAKLFKFVYFKCTCDAFSNRKCKLCFAVFYYLHRFLWFRKVVILKPFLNPAVP